MNMINFASSQLSILTCWKSRLELPKNIGANENDLHKMYNLFLNQSKLNNVKLFFFYHLWMPCKNTEQIKKQKSHSSYSCCFKAHHFLIDSYQDKNYCLLILKIGCFTTFNFRSRNIALYEQHQSQTVILAYLLKAHPSCFHTQAFCRICTIQCFFQRHTLVVCSSINPWFNYTHQKTGRQRGNSWEVSNCIIMSLKKPAVEKSIVSEFCLNLIMSRK